MTKGAAITAVLVLLVSAPGSLGFTAVGGQLIMLLKKREHYEYDYLQL